MDNPRTSRLNKHFDLIIRGKLALIPNNSPLFLEAICAQPDPATCINKLIASEKGLASVQASMRFDLSPTFCNGPAAALLKYIQAPELATIGGGNFLNQILLKIVEPPIFWTAFIQAFRDNMLQENAQGCFAWILLQLVSMSGDIATPYRELARDPDIMDVLLTSSQLETRAFGQKIKHILATFSSGTALDNTYAPGGRHDNDFVDFREIVILPTADEIMSKDPPFIRPSTMFENSETEDTLLATYLDNQFRLLREDMLYDMREELQIVLGRKKGNFRGLVIDGLTPLDVHYGTDSRRCKWGVMLQCRHDLWQFKKVKPDDRKTHLLNNRKILRNQSIACLIIDEEVVAFPTINRDEDLLANNPPIVILQFEGETSTIKALLKLKVAKHIKLIQIDTALFSFEPVLRALQETRSMQLSPEILFWKEDSIPERPLSQSIANFVETVRADPRQDLRTLLGTPQPIFLDETQVASLLSGLTQNVSLIQGPPGTGKSFIGALLAKVFHDFTQQTILVVCYTNHALDQFLEDLINIGIPLTSMVRLGGKSTTRTAPLSLQTLQRQPASFIHDAAGRKAIEVLKYSSQLLCNRLEQAFGRYKSSSLQPQDLLEYLEFNDPLYFHAFRVPTPADGMTRVAKKGRAASPDYLLNQWAKGYDAGMFKWSPNVRETSQIWKMTPDSRQIQITKWKLEILKEHAECFYEVAEEYNECQNLLNRKFGEGVAALLSSKRIIGCTTTAAAKYREDINMAHPDVLLVEEAGEILESHILTALGPETKQLILIGDHKQLRPKVNNYQLTVEKGEGYDLNRSLFERLVIKGYPHVTLSQQHRMRPEISALVRKLTYPDLVDAPKTQNRPNLRGVRDNIVFINHDHPEDNVPQLADRKDMSAPSSKQNRYEVGMVLKIVRYLGQQGYGTEKIVVLTPYLGQLRELQEALQADNDPILNDMDSYDLIRAGLLTVSAAKVSKKPIRLATIDNYQGEQSEIVIITLTRSNSEHDIGFMSSPERLNVLLSRAQDALIVIGNVETFLNARRGKELWTRFFDLIKHGGHIYDGLPVKCERHKDRIALLKCETDFDNECPDGGCKESCGTMLSCGVHLCPSKCHQLYNHSKMSCEHILYSDCPKGHHQQWKCHKGPPVACQKCDREAKLAEKKKKEDFALQEKQNAEQRTHDQRLAELDKKIALETQAIRDAQLAEEREYAIRQKEKDLEAAAQQRARQSIRKKSVPKANPRASEPSKTQTTSNNSDQQAPPPTTQPVPAEPPQPPTESPSQKEWQRQKEVEGASNDAIDAIMEMTGLEEVKAQVLRIKAKIDTTQRQNTSLKTERFNIVLLGNPGTGKTTVARHYAKFLASLQVLPGSAFIEATGSGLANDGVPGIKKHIEEVIKVGGGAIFVDEAYQLTSPHNFGGGPVLDYLLAEMENRVGTIVFILAGYNKEMEKFFEHNPGLTSRVPYRLQFADYTDAELLSMMEKLIEKKFNGQMKVEDGIRGLYGRIAVARLGRGRGREGFGNARALQILFAKIHERQAERLSKERKEGLFPDDFLLLKEDLIGPDPSKVILESAAWKKLQSLIGLSTVKNSIRNLFDLIEANYQRELQEKKPKQLSLNRVFLGSPGTGKTTVAKLYGQILADMRLISNGEVVMKNPADFIGSALGQSEQNTKTILATTVGKVLIIDEAYMLYGGTGGTAGPGDPYKTAVIDTIVAEVQSVPGEDRCVLLLGYKAQIVEMFQNVNPGLSRRFAIEDAFHFEDFTNSELLDVLNWKLKDQDLEATDAAKTVAIEVLSRARNRPNFGNAGEVENLLGQAKNRYQTRQASLPAKERSVDAPFEPQDFDPEFDRNENASTNLAKLFEDVVGCEDIIQKLGEYQKIARTMKARGMDTRDLIPTNFVFKGPPGTGKTTTARKMGQVYYDMGFLSSTDVVECSASDLVGQYVGQTGPKTKQVFEKALGRVLFVDEAYRLSEGPFAKEAMDELVGILTQEKFISKVVVILAGYDQEMNSLMAVNTGLSSRFPGEVVFRNMPPGDCLELLNRELKKKSIHSAALSDPSSLEYAEMVALIKELSRLPSWGNARDLKTLSKQMISLVLKNSADSGLDAKLILTGKEALTCTRSMLMDRRERCANVPPNHHLNPFQNVQQMPNDPPPAPSIHTTQSIKTTRPEPKKEATSRKQSDGRDVGVTDEVWQQLQVDKQKAEEAAKQTEALRLLEKALQEAAERELAELALAKKLAEARAKDAAEQEELKRKREEARLKEIAAREERARIAAALEAKRQEEERERQQEAKAQAALRYMGVCPVGYQWIKQSSGYRCAGGSHFVTNAQLGM